MLDIFRLDTAVFWRQVAASGAAYLSTSRISHLVVLLRATARQLEVRHEVLGIDRLCHGVACLHASASRNGSGHAAAFRPDLG
jgi:hypothetical protein